MIDEFYPGSKKRRKAVEPPKTREHIEIDDLYASPVKKVVGGVQIEFYTIGTLAKALDRPVATLRMWMDRGYFPSSPYRMKSALVNGKLVPGRRLYTRPMIEAAVVEFQKRYLFNRVRIDWQNHKTLTADLIAAWQLTKLSNT